MMLSHIRFLISKGITGLPGLWLTRKRDDPEYNSDPEFWEVTAALHLVENNYPLAEAALNVAAAIRIRRQTIQA